MNIRGTLASLLRKKPVAHRTPIRPAGVSRETQVGSYTPFGYRSAAALNAEGRVSYGAEGDYHMQYDREKLINESRSLMRDNPIYRGMINRAVDYIVGNGFNVQPGTGVPELDADLDRRWRVERNQLDARQMRTGTQLEAMVCRESLVCGDVGAGMTSLGKLQLFEAEQITSSKTADGILSGTDGAPITYHVSPYKRGRIDKYSYTAFKPRDFIHIAHFDRPSERRAVPVCQSAFSTLHRLNDICDSEAIAWQMLSKFVVSVNRDNGAGLAYGESLLDVQVESGDLPQRVTELDSAILFHGNPGESVSGIDRNIPGKNFDQSVRTFCRLLGLPLGIPLELILLDWSQANYSQSRAVLEQAYQTFTRIQELLRHTYYDRVYRWSVARWIRRGEIVVPDGVDPFAHDWVMPTFPWIDQLKEAEAQGMKLERNLTTHSAACKSQNLDSREVNDAREREILDAIQRAKNIEAATGVEVPWEHFAGLAVQQTTPEPQEPADTNTTGDNNEE